VVFCEGGIEDHLTERAVMVAFAMHLLRTIDGLKHVAIHPDGEHGKRFDLKGWLGKNGFILGEPIGQTSYGETRPSRIKPLGAIESSTRVLRVGAHC
jgi:hypothetical protein